MLSFIKFSTPNIIHIEIFCMPNAGTVQVILGGPSGLLKIWLGEVYGGGWEMKIESKFGVNHDYGEMKIFSYLHLLFPTWRICILMICLFMALDIGMYNIILKF